MGWVRSGFDSRQPDMSSLPPKDQKPPSSFSAFSLALTLGYTIAVPAILGTVLGRLADNYLGTTPIGIITGILLALTVSSLAIFYEIRKIEL